LIQKLNVDDLQLIVNSIRANEAHVCSADIKKDKYIDKILKVKLFNSTQSLSNGQNEALLKKSMFPKDLNLLFDSFVKALFREQYIYEDVSRWHVLSFWDGIWMAESTTTVLIFAMFSKRMFKNRVCSVKSSIVASIRLVRPK
jgi:hypothetical protein